MVLLKGCQLTKKSAKSQLDYIKEHIKLDVLMLPKNAVMMLLSATEEGKY